MSLLARREHSMLELQRKLLARDFSYELIQDTLQALAQEDLQSDHRFTESYVRMRANNGYGPERIEQELRERGINEQMIFEELSIYEYQWPKFAQDVWQKKFAGKTPEDFAEQAKQMKFLQYRGFSNSHFEELFN